MSPWPSVRCASWMFLALGVFSLPVAADVRDDYRLGIEALERGEWSQAATLFRQVIGERPDEKARITRSPFSRRYLPHFYLGQALLGMDDCEGSLVAWAESERQGIIPRLPEYQSLVEGRDLCREQAATRSESRTQAQVEIANAEAAAGRVDRLQAELGPERPGTGASLSTRYDDAQQRLLSARSQLTRAVAAEDLDGMRQAATMAREARLVLEAVERDAIQLQAQQRLQQGALISEVGSLLEEAEDQLRATTSLRPYPRQLGRVVAEVSSLVDQGRQPGLDQDLERLRELRGALGDALPRLKGAAAPPPTALTDAARAFFDGDYEKVLELLEDLDGVSRRVALEAHILRAAASFTLFQLGGAGGADLLEAARAEVASCLEISSAKRPPTAPFSPRFVEFFESQVEAGMEAAAVAEEPVLEESD